MPKPSERVSEIILEVANKRFDDAIQDPSIKRIENALGYAKDFAQSRREYIVESLTGDCTVYREALLIFLDEQQERIEQLERLVGLSKCQ